MSEADKEKAGEEKDDKSPDSKKKGGKKDKSPKTKGKKPGDEEEEDDEGEDLAEETLNIVTTPGPQNMPPGSKLPIIQISEDEGDRRGTPRGSKKRGILPKLFGNKDKSPGRGPGGAKKSKIRSPGASQASGRGRGSPPRGKSKTSPRGAKSTRSLVPPGVHKSTAPLKIPKI